MVTLQKDQLQSSTDLFDTFWNWRLRNFPEFATAVGVHTYDDILTDMSLDGFKRRCDESKAMQEEVDALMELSTEKGARSANLEVLASELYVYVNGSEQEAYLCPVNICEGLQYDFPRLLDVMPHIEEKHYHNILSRIQSLPKQIDQVIELMKEGIRKRKILHPCSICPVSERLREIINVPVQESPLFKRFVEKPPNISVDRWMHIVQEASSTIETLACSSLSKFVSFLESDYHHQCRHHISIGTVSNGNSLYRSCLRYHTSTDLTPEEIHATGLREVKRIQNRINDLLGEIEFNGSYVDILKLIKCNNADANPDEDIVEGYLLLYDKISKHLPKLFNCLPIRKCNIKTMTSVTTLGANYRQGNGDLPGVFWLNPLKIKGINFKSLALALHEMIPGHHLQSEVMLQKHTLPCFRRFRESGNYNMIPGRFPLYTALMEGWGLYAESLGEELGLYGNPYDLLGRLFSEIFRAARLVVDTGIHAFDWTKEQAVDYMVQIVGMEREHAISEVNRYITWPGQACAYKIGELKIKQFRAMTNDSLGDKFDVKEFHDIILHSGEVPFEVIERNIESYIKAKLNGQSFDAAALC